MAIQVGSLTFERTVHVPPPLVYRAFTGDVGLDEWLADEARAVPFPGGHLHLFWHDGRLYYGEYIVAVPNRSVAVTWSGHRLPGATRVDVTLDEVQGGTRLTLIHSGLGVGAEWEAAAADLRRGWERSLDNLVSVLETGIDLRVYGRPMLGIVGGDEVTMRQALLDGLPVTYGIRVSDVVPEMGAAAAGIGAGDVLVAVGKHEIHDWKSFPPAMAAYDAGDRVELTYYRGSERRTAEIVLSGRPRPTIPPDVATFAAMLRAEYASRSAAVAAVLAGASQESPAPRAEGTWGPLQVLAHMVTAERSFQVTVAAMLCDRRTPQWACEDSAWVGAIVATCPTLGAMRSELEHAQAQSAALVAGIPESFVARRGSYVRLADLCFYGLGFHFADHLSQLRTAIAAP